VYLQSSIRRQRQRDARRFGKGAFQTKGGRPGEASVTLTRHLSESTRWGLSRAIYDPAAAPLREE
jgi:hypothetical protein